MDQELTTRVVARLITVEQRGTGGGATEQGPADAVQRDRAVKGGTVMRA